MTKEKKEQIKAVYEMFNSEDISSARLLQMVADACDCDTCDVIDAVFEK